MRNKTVLLLVVLGLFSLRAAAQVDPPKLDPTPSTDKQTATIKEGVRLHDEGKYDAAISKYEEVLKENPNNVEALYELSYSYSMKKDYRKGLEIAYRGAQYKSKLLAAIYVQIGNYLDLLGESKKSVEAYKAGIKLQPHDAMLYYNLALSYRNLKKHDDARKALKQAIVLNPNHSSSHLFLATVWREGGYKSASLLAASRFLVLEPESRRSAAALKMVQDVMNGGATQGSNPNEINVVLDMPGKKDEGDFGALDLVLGLGRAATLAEKDKSKTEMQLMVEQFETVFAITSELDEKDNKNKFSWKFYVPYFSEMKRKQYVEPFVYYIHLSGGDAEVKKWIDTNRTRVNEFLTWSKGYAWPQAE